MALPSTIYRTNIRIADIDRGVYETLQTSVVRHPSETEERLAARLPAYFHMYLQVAGETLQMFLQVRIGQR